MDDPVTSEGQGTGPAEPRSVKRILASIVLGFEVVIVFLAALVVFGLGALPPVAALSGGAILCLLLAVTIGLLRFRAGYVVGWALQGVLVLTGFLNPVMFFIGAVFAGMWVYCMVAGERIDKAKETA